MILIKNAHIATMDRRYPEAEAAVIEGERFALVGSGEACEDYARQRGGARETVDLGGRLMVPGFNDSHLHFMEYVRDRHVAADLVGAASVEDLVERLRRFGEKRGDAEWIVGEGWNHDKFDGEKRFPTRRDLDRVSATRPVLAVRVCGHIGALNSAGLRRLGIDPEAAGQGSPLVGTFDDGTPDGTVREFMLDHLRTRLPMPDGSALVDLTLAAQEELFACGLTSIQSEDLMTVPDGSALDVIERLRQAERDGQLLVNLGEQCRLDTPGAQAAFYERLVDAEPEGAERSLIARPGRRTGRFALTALKLILDGSLGARTARMSRDYADDPGNRGVLTYAPGEAEAMVLEAHRRDFPVVAHAIGDETIRLALDAFRQAKEACPRYAPRHGLIHCQITDGPLLRRLRPEGVTCFAQPVFIDYDMTICADRVGPELAATSYAWKTLLDDGARVSFGTDCPVESFNPMEGLWCAVTRQRLGGSAPFNPDQAMGLEDAIRCYTWGSAAAEGMEHEKGLIRAGYLADFTVLDRDILRLGADAIPGTRPDETWVRGGRVYAR